MILTLRHARMAIGRSGATMAAAAVAVAVVSGGAVIGQCDDLVYDPGDTPSGARLRVVGASSPDARYEVFQPIELEMNTLVCGIDVDGAHVAGNPSTFLIGICAEDGDGVPDVANPLTSAAIDLGGSGEGDWTSVIVQSVCLEAGVTYFVFSDTDTDNDHQSGVYSDPGFDALDSFSILNGEFDSPLVAPPLAIRLRGADGCTPSTCLTLAVDQLVAGEISVWSIMDMTPGEECALVYGLLPGETVVSGPGGYCATFTIKGVNLSRVIGRANANGAGVATISRRIPAGARGVSVGMQAAERNTCPTECMSNRLDMTVE